VLLPFRILSIITSELVIGGYTGNVCYYALSLTVLYVKNVIPILMSGGAVFGNWLFGSTVIVVVFMVFYLCFKREG